MSAYNRFVNLGISSQIIISLLYLVIKHSYLEHDCLLSIYHCSPMVYCTVVAVPCKTSMMRKKELHVKYSLVKTFGGNFAMLISIIFQKQLKTRLMYSNSLGVLL